MSPRTRKLLEWLLGGLIACAVLIALLGAAFGVIVTRVPEYRVEVQDWLRERSGLVVEFRSLRARWRLYGPELVFDEAIVRTPDRTGVLATAAKGSVGFDIWGAIRSGRLRAGRFMLESPQLGVIRTKDGRIQLVGQSSLPERDTPFAIDQLPTGRFDVMNAVVSFRDEITGRGPWSVSGVSFELTRASTRLQIEGKASLPSALGRELKFAADVHGSLEAYESLSSTFSVGGNDLDLAGWADVLPDAWPAPETGHGGVHVQGALQGSQLVQLTAAVDLHDLAAEAPNWSIPLPTAAPLEQPDALAAAEQAADDAPTFDLVEEAEDELDIGPQIVSYDRIAFTLQGRRAANSWDVRLSKLHLSQKQLEWRADEVHAQWTRDAHGAFKLAAAADRIELASVWPLLAFLPESESLARARALRATGALEDLNVSFERAEGSPPKYAVNVQLADVGFAPIEKAPGFAGLSGAVEATEQGGHWRLEQQDVQFELPRWFRAPLAATVHEGHVAWRRENDAWVIEGEQFELSNTDGRATARFTARVPGGDASPVLDISAHGEKINVAGVGKYIPAGRFGARTMEWFDQAFLGGAVTSADFVYRGPTRSFPFRRGEGEFVVRAHVEDGALSYQPEWPPATDITADVEFRNAGMRIDATAGEIAGLQLRAAHAEIPDFKLVELNVTAAAAGDVQAGLQLLKTSPLGPALGEEFAKLDGQGALNADVRLFLPIKQMTKRDVTVTARLSNATAGYQGVDAPVRNVFGALTVRNTLLARADLRGRWLGQPIEATITPDGPAASMLTVHGRSPAPQLANVLQAPKVVGVSGALEWRLSTRLEAERTEGAARVFRFDSDTRGLAVSLPAPLGKAAESARDLQATLEFKPNALVVRGAFGDVRSLLSVRRGATGWAFDRGGVRADGVAPSLPDHAGLRIEGTIDRFVLDDWLRLRGDGGAAGVSGGKPLSTYLRAANVRVREFELMGYRWPDIRALLQTDRAGWRIDVSGSHAQGQVLIPEHLTGDQPLRAALERLVLERASGGVPRADADTPTDPRALPALQVHIGDLRIGPRLIGVVDIAASRTPQGLRFDNVSIQNPSVRAEGRGQWFMVDERAQSALKASVLSSDVAATLAALNYTGFLQAKEGEIRADLAWPGGFDDNILAHASGALSVRVESGQIVNLQPGAGKMLGLFSIAALPRRLALDFSDLTEKGLAFDTISGDFELRDGQAYTSNLLLRGPAAEIGVAGRTGFNSRDYDQTAVVTGNLGASLPIAGALAGGPALGAAVLLFSQVFKEPLKGITRGYYRITGPWDNPSVERIEASEAASASGTGARLESRR